jgi:predicted enzyme related to lactoylglutathione lyase
LGRAHREKRIEVTTSRGSKEGVMDEAYYVGFRVGDQEIGLDPHGHNQGMTGPVGYWQVNDIQKNMKLLLNAGAQTQQEVKDVGGGKLIASVTDSDSNVIGVIVRVTENRGPVSVLCVTDRLSGRMHNYAHCFSWKVRDCNR